MATPIAKDIYILEGYPIRANQSVILGVKNNQHLVYVKRSDVTARNLFLRIFNQGPLAHTHVSLSNLTSYLGRYDWKELEGTPHLLALRRVQQLAGLILLKKGVYTLWRRVSTLTHTKNGEYYLNPTCTANIFWEMAYKKVLDENGGLQVKDFLVKRIRDDGRVVRPHPSTSMATKEDVNKWTVDWNFTYHYTNVRYMMNEVVDRYNPNKPRCECGRLIAEKA